MMNKNKMILFPLALFALSAIAFIGCGGSGGSDSTTSTTRPTLEVLPADHDFGIITDANTVAPLDVTIKNIGTANLSVSDIQLSDTLNFHLDLNGGANPCASAAPTIIPGSSCTATVDFDPQSFTTFSADLTIQSNDPNTPVYDLGLLGSKQDILAVTVKINQIEPCPRLAAKAYVSVIDQAGFPVIGLGSTAFVLSESVSGAVGNPTSAGFVDDTVTLSVALVLDYSGSITAVPENLAAMEDAAISFVNQLGPNDEAEIIKYADTVQVMESFSDNKTALIDAIRTTPNVGVHTALYDAVVQAVTNISTRTKARRAIIIITDGVDDDGTGNPQSINTINDAINDANGDGVPVFTVGLGGAADVAVLQQLADDTGGTYSDSTTAANLSNIYQQLADLLFTDQYILTYASGVADGTSEDLTVTATFSAGPPLIADSDTKTIPAVTCP